MAGKKWTDEELNILKELSKEGCTQKDIAKRMDRPYTSIVLKLKSLEIKVDSNVKQWTETEIKHAIKLYREGFNYSEIGKKIGRGKGTVKNKLQSLGVAKPKYTATTKHIYKVGEIVGKGTLKIVKQTRDSKNRKSYIVKSLAFPKDENDYMVAESNIKNGIGCAYSSNPIKRICEENSLWSKINIRKNIVDIDQAKKTAPFTHDEILFKCENEDCDYTKKVRPINIIERGFICNKCGNGMTYPELFMLAYLEIKNIPYKHQYKLKNSQRRFDFYNSIDNIAYEVNGLQHYQDAGYMKYEESQKQDIFKKNYCKENNIKLIVIDARESKFKFIKQKINECEHLPNIEEYEIEKMLKIIEENKKYPIKKIIRMYKEDEMSTTKIGKELGIKSCTITNILHRSGVELVNNTQFKKGEAPKNKIYLPEEEICLLYKKGFSISKISKTYKVSTRPITRILKDNNVEIRKPGNYRKNVI